MAKELEQMAQKFLDQINEDPAFESLVQIVEMLENKVDPEPTEVRLCENIYAVIERMKVLESNIRTFVNESRQILPGNKLANLIEDTSHNGSGSSLKD